MKNFCVNCCATKTKTESGRIIFKVRCVLNKLYCDIDTDTLLEQLTYDLLAFYSHDEWP